MPELIWEGKDAVINYHHSLPVRELKIDQQDSLSPEPSLDDNLIIEGDNIEVLKSLIPKFASKVDVIYIDPPYNTGNENWVYNDNLNSPQIKSWLGNVVGKEDLQRHDKWLCMMYPRLVLARELLSESGVIFISIDDNEVHNLKQIMNEIFGDSNFICEYCWKSRDGKDHTAKNISINHEYILCYSKNNDLLTLTKDTRIREGGNYSDDQGSYSREQLRQWGTNDRRIDRPTMFYPVKAPDGTDIYPIKENGDEGCWRISQARMNSLIEENLIDFLFDKIKQKWILYAKKYDGKETSTAYSSLLDKYGSSANGTKEFKALFNEKLFDTVKPIELIKHLLHLTTNHKSHNTILDFFAGSGTTGHAVLEMNKEDGGNRKFILVQIPEKCNPKSEASKQNFKNIFEITTARIRRCIEGVATAKDPKLQEGLGGSFTVVKLGEVLHLNTLFLEKDLPSYEALASYLFYHTTNQALSKVTENVSHYIGKTENYKLYLIYSADKEKLKHHDYALSRSKLEQILKDCGNGYQALIYAVTIYVDNKSIKSLMEKERYTKKPIICQIPYQYLQINSANVLNNLEDSED